jgi:hypothetical protein
MLSWRSDVSFCSTLSVACRSCSMLPCSCSVSRWRSSLRQHELLTRLVIRLLCKYRCLSRKLSSSPLTLDRLLLLSHSTSSVLKRPSASRSSLSTPSPPQKSSVRSFLYPSCTPNGMQSSGLSVTIDPRRGRNATTTLTGEGNSRWFCVLIIMSRVCLSVCLISLYSCIR